MKRITMLTDSKSYYIPDTDIEIEKTRYIGSAIDRLAKFEDFYFDLEKDIKLIAEEMDKLRDDDKTHSPRFKELFVKKMINSNILMMLKYYGLE
jgi:hypothetical protein